MRSKFFKTVFLLVVVAPLALAQENIKVLTFNIWDPNDVPFWEKCDGFPVDAIVTYLSEDKADVLLLQEVSLENGTKDQVYDKLKTKLKEKGYLYSAFYRPDYSKGKGDLGYYRGMKSSGYPLAILSKYPILETYAKQSDNDIIMSKGVLGIKIEFNQKPLYIFNTHFTVGAEETNVEMSKVVIPFINQVAVDAAVIFGGDFNSPSATDTPHSKMTFGKYTYSSETDQFLLDDGFVDVYAVAKKGDRDIKADATCPGQDDYIKRVDRIYSRNTNLKPIKAFVKENPWVYCGKVDHRGVFVEFKRTAKQLIKTNLR